MTKRLLIIVPDFISAWVNKGEVIDRYYNPGNLFEEVHIMMTNDDKPDPAALQKMVGKAKLFLYNYPEPDGFFKKTLGWQLWLMEAWAEGAIKVAQDINPNLIRCYGAHLNTFLAYKIKEGLGIPYVVSLHINPDENFRKSAKNIKDKIIFGCLKKIERVGLRNANLVMPVYEPIVPYLKSLGVKNYKVCYNVLNAKHLMKKDKYALSSPTKILSVGRQFIEKDPTNLILALKQIEDIHITFIGNGEYHERLKNLVTQEALGNKASFKASINNDELCKSLHTYDFLAIHTDYFEISKVVLESFLVGLPVLLNYRSGDQVPELKDDICLRVENSVEGYRIGLATMMKDHTYRESLGRNAYRVAQEKWHPKKCEQMYVDIYKQYIG